MWGLGGMMQMMQMLMALMGSELPGSHGLMPDSTMMTAANPLFGRDGPMCQGGDGMQSFLGQPGTSGPPSPDSAPSTRGAGGGRPVTETRRPGRRGFVSDEIVPGTDGMLERARNMEGMRGDRDSAELRKITGRLDPATQPWCAAWAMNMLDQHDVLDLDGLRNRAYTPTIEKWARDKGIYGTPDQYTPKPGDAILFDWQGKRGSTDHIGIVEKVEDGWVHTIEGNASDRVMRRKFKLDDPNIDGYVVTKGTQQR